MLNDFFAALYASSLAAAIRESDAFPWLEALHVIAIVTVTGTISIVDLRLLGVAAHKRSVRHLMAELLPFTWIAFGVALVTGSLLFVSNAPAYARNAQFQMKLLFIVLAGLNMALFNLVTRRSLISWDDASSPPRAAKIAGLCSLALWTSVIFLGRWIGFTLDVFG
jgi:uncharacterized membrane protein